MGSRTPIRTERLILRPYAESDVEGFHALRSQEEVMVWTSYGKPDADLDFTRNVISKRLPGSEGGEAAYEWAICIAETGEFIGTGGSHLWSGELGWPVIGYMLRKEFWGKGYATELVRGFLQAWWALPRHEVDLKVERSTVGDDWETALQRENIVAVTVAENGASQKVLGKTSFTLNRVWFENDEVLHGYVAVRPDASLEQQ